MDNTIASIKNKKTFRQDKEEYYEGFIGWLRWS